MTFLDRLKNARNDLGLSQKEVAEKLNIPVRTYASYERGERDISTATLTKICEALDISSDYLLGRDVSPLPLIAPDLPDDPQERIDALHGKFMQSTPDLDPNAAALIGEITIDLDKLPEYELRLLRNLTRDMVNAHHKREK